MSLKSIAFALLVCLAGTAASAGEFPEFVFHAMLDGRPIDVCLLGNDSNGNSEKAGPGTWEFAIGKPAAGALRDWIASKRPAGQLYFAFVVAGKAVGAACMLASPKVETATPGKVGQGFNKCPNAGATGIVVRYESRSCMQAAKQAPAAADKKQQPAGLSIKPPRPFGRAADAPNK